MAFLVGCGRGGGGTDSAPLQPTPDPQPAVLVEINK